MNNDRFNKQSADAKQTVRYAVVVIARNRHGKERVLRRLGGGGLGQVEVTA